MLLERKKMEGGEGDGCSVAICDNVNAYIHSLLFVCSACSEHQNMRAGALWALSTSWEVRFHCGSFALSLCFFPCLLPSVSSLFMFYNVI